MATAANEINSDSTAWIYGHSSKTAVWYREAPPFLHLNVQRSVNIIYNSGRLLMMLVMYQ